MSSIVKIVKSTRIKAKIRNEVFWIEVNEGNFLYAAGAYTGDFAGGLLFRWKC